MDVSVLTEGGVSMKRILFISIEGCLYISFLWMDLFGNGMGAISNKVKYISILVCFFYVLTALEKEGEERDLILLKWAMFFTLLSDTFLLLVKNMGLGVSSFVVVQLIYRFRLRKCSCFDRKGFSSLGVAVAILLVLFVLGVQVDYVLCIAVFYFVLFVSNVFYGMTHPVGRMFQIGLFLYFLCDINVALYNLASYVTLSSMAGEMIYEISSIAIWLFYLSGQVCLACSVKRGK